MTSVTRIAADPIIRIEVSEEAAQQIAALLKLANFGEHEELSDLWDELHDYVNVHGLMIDPESSTIDPEGIAEFIIIESGE